MTESPVFMTVMLDLSGMTPFLPGYAGQLPAHNKKYNDEVIVATPNSTVTEGTCAKSMTAVLRFPSADAPRDLHTDAALRPQRPSYANRRPSCLEKRALRARVAQFPKARNHLQDDEPEALAKGISDFLSELA